MDGTARAYAPMLGEHTAEVLRQHGYDEQQIGELAAGGAIGLIQPTEQAAQ